MTRKQRTKTKMADRDSDSGLRRGGGGFSPDFCENTILRYELAMMARTCNNNLRVVLSP